VVSREQTAIAGNFAEIQHKKQRNPALKVRSEVDFVGSETADCWRESALAL